MASRAQIVRPMKPRGFSPPVVRARSTANWMIETLETAFSQRQGRPVRVRRLQFVACEYVSSFQVKRLRVLLDTGECVPVFFKDLNPNCQTEIARSVRAPEVGPSDHELHVYQQILSRLNLGTAELYALRWEPERDIYWIFLEDLGTSRLRECRNHARWVPAARWAARFHAQARHLPACLTNFLRPYDFAHYQRCAERVRKILPDLNALDRALVARALDQYVTQIEWFAALPRTVVHGQFFGQNIMIRAWRGDRMLAPIDWETAALGPGGFDLVSLSSGHWTHQERLALWRAYFDEYQGCTGLSRTWKAFCRELRNLEIYQALEWIGWWRNRSVSHNFDRWIKELHRIVHGSRTAGRESIRQ